MAPKGKNVSSGSGTKRSRKGAATESSNRETTNLLPQKFGEKTIMHYGKDWYECQQESKYLGDKYVDEGSSLTKVNWNTHCVELNRGFIRESWVRFTVEALHDFLGTPNCDNAEFMEMIERPPYCDISHTLCGVNFVVWWDRVRDTGRHLTLHYGHFNLEARIWLKIVCSTLLPCKHTTDVTRERVVLVYRLMKGLPVNVWAILRQNMLKLRTNKR
ncbi:hypothetical protein H5410_040313 [Solanum commersonii]|uniref:Putative plant transposon protein domain-containing protein n=1 Tax=Solanum commersonii TaxID=4109 RepID=A0A9J5XQL0_SOLCO|nr:hypothetical protein H5410_040313 [Solanum commersonii]